MALTTDQAVEVAKAHHLSLHDAAVLQAIADDVDHAHRICREFVAERLERDDQHAADVGGDAA